jgi:hypothetical protein
MCFARWTCVLVALLAVHVPASHAADAFAKPGSKATLTVDYLYESAGTKRSEGMYDPYEWRVRRNLTLAADLAAQPPTAMPTVQPFDASQMAALEGKGTREQAVAAGMSPMVVDLQKAIAQCAGNEACIQREAMKVAASAHGAQSAGENPQGAPRYQAWRPTAQKGTYLIDESAHISVTDPICTGKPRHRCTRDESRKGSGEVPTPVEAGSKSKGAAAGISAVEVDAAKGMLTISLPVPGTLLSHTEVITTDEPEGTHDTPTPKGPHKRDAIFRVSGSGTGFMHDKPFTVALKGGWRSQEGEYAVPLKGSFGDGGTLKVRWRFRVL